MGLKAGIHVDGKASLLSASLSCDATLGTPAVVVNSNYNTIQSSFISECRQGLRVAGNRNQVVDSTIKKTVATPLPGETPQLGVVGVQASGMGNFFYGITVTGYRTGVRLSGANNILDEWSDPKLPPDDPKKVVKTSMSGYLQANTPPLSNTYGVYITADGNRVRHSVIDQFERGVVVLAAQHQGLYGY